MKEEANTYRTTARVVDALYIAGVIVGIAGFVPSAPGQFATVSANSMMVAINYE